MQYHCERIEIKKSIFAPPYYPLTRTNRGPTSPTAGWSA
jgi:hypothetical protein